jgi:hypothetical protein
MRGRLGDAWRSWLLSVAVLLEQRRIQDTLRDIEAFQPELVLTIDSKGFTFRVLKALQAAELETGGKRTKKAHYVAPSVWAYKHRGKRDFTELRQLLDAMFTILPFEEELFQAGSLERGSHSEMERSWCHFVGHPAVEDFLEVHGAYKSGQHGVDIGLDPDAIQTATDALLDLSKYDRNALRARGRLFDALANRGREPSARKHARARFGIPADAYVVCALVGRYVEARLLLCSAHGNGSRFAFWFTPAVPTK